jgi:broad specificity phosphatase PhoE
MRTSLLLIRHAESRNQVQGVIGGPKGDTGLTQLGESQARALADRLSAATRVSALLCSSLPRAVDTAKIIAPAVGDPVIEPLDGLAYRWPPEADGMFLAKHRRRHALPGGGVFRPYQQGEESWAEFIARVGATLAKISCDHVDERVAVITHDEVIDASLRVFGDLPPRSVRRPHPTHVDHRMEHHRRPGRRRATGLPLCSLGPGPVQRHRTPRVDDRSGVRSVPPVRSVSWTSLTARWLPRSRGLAVLVARR